ncbi:DUF6255 family natural product biosynthesis protein [Streptomyces sp. NPDC026206]|uniref:DUF6255 family natural product biosynthesis protein n=1 Tax=Streptomyces sp. NPDC026206 TaxID=3157089 RepID=UPI0033F3CB46
MRRPGCAHPEAGWTASRGIATCGSCGVRRFREYAALWWPGRGGDMGGAPRSKPTVRTTGVLLLRA